MNSVRASAEVDEQLDQGDLPEGWTQIPLGHVVDTMKNGLYKPANAYSPDGVACLRMYNIDGGRIVWKDIKRMRLSREEIEEYGLAQGDLLVNRVNSRELVGKTALIPAGLETCVYESKNIRVRLIPELVYPELVNYRLLYAGQRHFNFNSQQVVGMASISQTQIASLPLPLPPANEQARIVHKIEHLQARVNLSRDHLAKVPKILKAFRQSVLAAACSGRLTEDWREKNRTVESAEGLLDKIKRFRSRVAQSRPALESVEIAPDDDLDDIPETWCWVQFGNVIGELRNGISTKPEQRPPGNPILRISSVRSGAVLLDDRRYLPSSNALVDIYHLRDDDLLFTRYNGSLDLLGVCGMVRGLGAGVLLYPDKLMRTRIDHPYLLPAYVELFFRAGGARDRMTAKSKSSAGQQGISGSDVKAQLFALPPFEEQHEIVHRVEALFQLADAIEERVAAATKRADKLTQSILAKAFRGELVPTEAELARQEGRDYEPASVLLERIKAEREQGTASVSRLEDAPS